MFPDPLSALLDNLDDIHERHERDMQFLERLKRDPEMTWFPPDWPDAKYCAEDIPHWVDDEDG